MSHSSSLNRWLLSGVALGVAASAIGFLGAALDLIAPPSARAESSTGEPELSVQPTSLVFLAEVATPTVQTRTLNLANLTPGTSLTWTVTISPPAKVQPIVSPLTGTNSATLIVQLDTSTITTTGTYTAAIIIAAKPSNTIGNPITVPITVMVIDRVQRAYLPLIANNYPARRFQMGLVFVSAAEYPASETRYQRALDINGRINRWPMYWSNIETDPITNPRVFDWSRPDANVSADLNHGLTVLPILLSTPIGLDTGGSRSAPMPQIGASSVLPDRSDAPQQISSVTSPPQGLDKPIFDDNSDIPGPGKSINPDNRWAYFVNAAVNRYKPGGTLAQVRGWSSSWGVRYWEMWNEPDLDTFFTGTITDYARLLKVGYLAAKFADPQAQIVLGGMAHHEKPQWFSSLLNVIGADPDAVANHYFMDKVAVHNYFWSWQTFGYLYPDRAQLDSHGLTDVALWLTEIGVPVCGEGTFPACDDPINRWYRATSHEQADFLIQSAAFATWLKTEVYLWFQLYDDCGNECGVDAYGLVRNDNTTRPSYMTYALVNNLFASVQPYWRQRLPDWSDPVIEVIAFKRPASGERVVVLWNRFYTGTQTALITATASSAQLIFPDGSLQTIYPISGAYAIDLPAATNRNLYGTTGGVAPDGSAPIGGSPRILVESDPAVK